MDESQIKRINREALRKAEAAEGGSPSPGGSPMEISNKQIINLSVASAVGLLTYYLLYKYEPNFSMSTVEGQRKFDKGRAIIIASIVALCTLLVMQMFYKRY